MGVWQRGHFMRWPLGHETDPTREYNVGALRAWERPRDSDLAARLFGGRPEHTLALLRSAWPVAVGAKLARRTEVVALDHGVLRIKVEDARWQRTLLRMRTEILSRLRGVAAGVAPRGLGFVVGALASNPDPIPAVMQEAPLAAAPPRAVAEAAAAIPDPEVRARFLAAAARYLARFGPGQASGNSGSTTT
jgi:Dna[CI] antecedent DciA-like protein